MANEETKVVEDSNLENEVKMTPEILAKLQGCSVVSDTITYTHEVLGCPKHFQPNAIIKAFSVSDSKKFKEASDSKDADVDDILDEMVRTHIVGWDNLWDQSTCQKIKWVADKDGPGTDKELYYALPLGFRASILDFLYGIAGLL